MVVEMTIIVAVVKAQMEELHLRVAIIIATVLQIKIVIQIVTLIRITLQEVLTPIPNNQITIITTGGLLKTQALVVAQTVADLIHFIVDQETIPTMDLAAALAVHTVVVPTDAAVGIAVDHPTHLLTAVEVALAVSQVAASQAVAAIPVVAVTRAAEVADN